jgi:voltage-gated potassium channel
MTGLTPGPIARERVPKFSLPLRGPSLALVLLAVVLVGGTVGYVIIEGWGVWDSLYMTVTTVATVGYREVHPLSWAGQAFTLLLVIGGVGTALYAFSTIAGVIVEGGWDRFLQQRRLIRMLNNLNNHFILCGYGRIGSIIADQFQRQATPFVIIDADPARVQSAQARGYAAILADASHDDTLMGAGIQRARGLVAAVGTDAENVYTILTARVLRPDLFVVGRAESEDSINKLRRAGADRVVSPYQIGATQMAQTALRPAVVDFVELATSSENLELSIEQVTIGKDSTLANRSLIDANLRQRFGVIVVCIQRQDGKMEFNPASDAVMRAGDQLVVLGPAPSLKDLEDAAKSG